MQISEIYLGQKVKHIIVGWTGTVTKFKNAHNAKDFFPYDDVMVEWDDKRGVMGCFASNLVEIKEKPQSVESGKFIIGSVDANGNVSFSKKPVQHKTRLAANTEAERLAEITPNKEFMVVEILGIVQSTGISWR